MGKYILEYVTSAVSLLAGDGIVVHVVNDGSVKQNTRVIIYRNTGAGANISTDSGDVIVTPTWVWGLGYTLSTNGEYWLRVQATSENLIPKASFERPVSSVWSPQVTYLPNDFAIFKLKPVKRRIW
jgi:hypothetical protein